MFVGNGFLAILFGKPTLRQERIREWGKVARISLYCVYVISDLAAFRDEASVFQEIIRSVLSN
jgi:hypothetical protein